MKFLRATADCSQRQDASDFSHHDPGQFDSMHASQPDETPTSNLLAPVTERKVKKRSRSMKRTALNKLNTPFFPPTFPLADGCSSALSRHSKPVQVDQANVTRDQSLELPSQFHDMQTSAVTEATEKFSAMSLKEIRAAQEEIRATLNQESLDFLKQRSQAKLSEAEPAESHRTRENALSAEHCKSAAIKFPPSDADELPLDDTSIGSREEGAGAGVSLRSAVSCESSSVVIKDSVADGLGDEDTVMDGNDEEKRRWMTDAVNIYDGQNIVDGLLEVAVEKMGADGSLRFDLEGEILTPQEIENLPTHLGLHHHGSSPASAGYTLADILTLSRSTVMSQRVMSLRIFARMLHRHGDTVLDILLPSGGLALLFSEFPASEAFRASLTNQVAYLETVEAVLTRVFHTESDELSRDCYFASALYSSSSGISSPVADVFAEPSCLDLLLRMAKQCFSSQPALGERALNMMRVITVHSHKACDSVLTNESFCSRIQELCIGNDRLNPSTTMLSCDILAHVTSNAAWGNLPGSQSALDTVFADQFLNRLTAHLTWVLREDLQNLTHTMKCAAKGVLRLFRAAFAFERGVSAFTTAIRAVCCLVEDNDDVGSEAYLGLEAYTHCLYSRYPGYKIPRSTVVQQSEDTSNAPRVGEDEMTHVRMQLSSLVPVAVSAIRVFSTKNPDVANTKKAAAGHFAATLFSNIPLPLKESWTNDVLNTCSTTSAALQQNTAANIQDMECMQTLGSVSQAGARLLRRVKLQRGYIAREAKLLLEGAETERRVLNECTTEKPWRPIANGCAEWLAKWVKDEPSVDTIRRAIHLLPYLRDILVIANLLSQIICSLPLLGETDQILSLNEAEQGAKVLIPAALEEVSSPHTVEDCDNKDRGRKALSAMENFCDLWIRGSGTFESSISVVAALFKARLLNNTALFESLLQAPVSECCQTERLFRLLFEVGIACVENNEPLISSQHKTVLGAMSTDLVSDLSKSILSLCDLFVARGPLIEIHTADLKSGFPTGDPLASVIFSIMCREDVDISLRLSLWQKTVDDCGGGLLFASAHCITGGSACERTVIRREDELLGSISVSMARGLLDGERCPLALRKFIAERFVAHFHDDIRTDPIGEVFGSLQKSARLAAMATLKGMLEDVTLNEKRVIPVRELLSLHMSEL